MGNATFREKVRVAYRSHRAILLLTRSLRQDERERIDFSLNYIDLLSGPQLRKEWKKLEPQIKATRKQFGVRGSLADLEAVLAVADQRPESILNVLKIQLLQLFTKYENALPVFPKLPLHARIGLDVNGLQGELSWHLLEAVLFEDLAALWNAAFRSRDQVYPAPKPKIKEGLALQRATAKAAFNLLEGYLNGVADDALLLNYDDLTNDERAKLLEHDDAKKRQVHLSLRDKLLQYPKIATRSQHPPLHESSCPSMREILAFEQQIRHALIHPNTRSGREDPFLQLSIDDIAKVCDQTAELIRAVAATLPPLFGDVSIWLASRGSDGMFPDSVFD